MSDLNNLADRVEALDGPSREVDREVFDAVTGGVFGPENAKFWHSASWSERQANAFTASLDAAMSLVPEGWHTGAYHQGPSGQPHHWILRTIRDQIYVEREAKATTPALALVAASLRAIAQGEG